MFGRRQIEGYCMDEVVSALQKSIRRGEESHALYWAHVMYRGGYWNASFNRLKIISMEDVAGNLAVAPYVYSQFKRGERSLKSKKLKLTESKNDIECLEALNCAVVALARAPKTRCLNFWLGFNRKQLLGQDMISAKKCQRRLQDMIDTKDKYGVDLNPHRVLRYCIRMIVLGKEKELWSLLGGAYVPDFGKLNSSLAAAHRLATLLSGVKGGVDHMMLPFVWDESSFANIDGKVPMSTERLEIPDEAIDKHTGRGKRMGRGWQHFSQVGSKVNNELFPDPWVEKVAAWYAEREAQGLKPKSSAIMQEIAQRWGIEKKKKETKRKSKQEASDDLPKAKRSKTEAQLQNPKPKKAPAYQFPKELDTPDIQLKQVSRNPMDLEDARYVQMPCGWKPGCLVGLDVESKTRVFVKGPETFAHVKTQLFLNNVIKPKLRELQYEPMEGLEWEGKYYLRMRDLSDERRVDTFRDWRGAPIKIMGDIANGDAPYSLNFAPYLEELSWDGIPMHVQRQYLAIILYRKIFGVSDTNHRNCMITRFPGEEVRLLSVDETVMLHDMPSREWIYSCPKQWIDTLPAKFELEKAWIEMLLDEWEPHLPAIVLPRLAKVREMLHIETMQM